MAKISVINLKGEKVKDITLNDNVWNVEINDVVLKNSLRLALNSLRQGTAKTKSRAEVSGSGKKPWKQKGTGRARVGSKRNPLWTGGGHTFALSNRDYGYTINKKERVTAIKSALSDKYQSKELTIIDDVKLNSLKTKDLIKTLEALKISGKTLFVTIDENENLFMACRNLENIGSVMADELNILDVVNTDNLIIDEASVNKIEEVLK